MVSEVFLTVSNHTAEGEEQIRELEIEERFGVLLIGHGQPDQWDRQWPTETEHELAFRNGVLDLLVADGFPRQNVSLAWMEFKQPHPAPKVEELAAAGVRRVLYFAAAISADAMHSQYDLPHLVARAKIPAEVQTINLGAWNDDPLVIQAIKEKIDPLLDRRRGD